MLDQRLLCVASMVREGAKLADIGTDHAYLPVYLVQNHIVCEAIAADIGKGPAASARKTVEAAALSDRIAVRVGDGLSVIAPDEVTDIVIAGMGGETIIHILDDASWTKEPSLRLVLQPMTKTVELRQWLFDNGFVIDEERVVCDAHHIYSVMAARFADAKPPSDPLAAYVGALRCDAQTAPYFERQCTHLQNKIDGLRAGAKECQAAEAQRVLQRLKALMERGDML